MGGYRVRKISTDNVLNMPKVTESVEKIAACITLSLEQCDQIGLFCKGLGNKFRYKNRPNLMVDSLGYFKNIPF